MTKTCTKCKTVQTTTNFNKDRQKSDGLSSHCRDCSTKAKKTYYSKNSVMLRKAAREYSQNHKSEKREYDLSYYSTNREVKLKQFLVYANEHKHEKAEYDRSYRTTNKDSIKITKGKHYNQNSEHIKDKAKQWAKLNPQKRLETFRIRRARKLSVQENYTRSDEKYTRLIFNGKCANCGTLENLCIDHHKPLCKGNALTRKNAVLLCKSCNSRKHASDPEDFYSPDKLHAIESALTLLL